jgi:tetratricopeptide (TPR) repeat protein
MTATILGKKEETYPHSKKISIHHLIEPVLYRFDRILQAYMAFNLIFLTIGCAEFTLLLFFFTFLVNSSILAFSLAIAFLTAFSYFILRLYFQTKKPEQFQDLVEEYISSCRQLINEKEGSSEYSGGVALVCTKLADSFYGKEFNFYHPPEFLRAFTSQLKLFSFWCHWNDVFKIKELLLKKVVEESIKRVKGSPTSLEAHASLANAYVLLSQLYLSFLKEHEDEEMKFHALTPAKALEFKLKFEKVSQQAIEELKILNEFSPNDPWIHLQLAYSYRDLKMKDEEILEYETILKLNPEDHEVRFKLGVLYFQYGKNAKALKLYEQLKRVSPTKSEELIQYYGVE